MRKGASLVLRLFPIVEMSQGYGEEGWREREEGRRKGEEGQREGEREQERERGGGTGGGGGIANNYTLLFIPMCRAHFLI